MLERKYFGIDDDDEVEAGCVAWTVVHEVLTMIESQKLKSINAVYVANYLSWRIAELIADEMTKETELIRFLEMMNESNRAYMNDVLVGWRHAHDETTANAGNRRP